MAWFYPDFDTAFTDWLSYYASHQSDMNTVNNQLQIAWTAGFSAAGYKSVWQAVEHLRVIIRRLVGDQVVPWEESKFNNMMYYAGQGGIDMQGIIDAMMDAEFAQLKHFIGIEDAYRASIWDQPFEAEFYANLVRTWRT